MLKYVMPVAKFLIVNEATAFVIGNLAYEN